MKQLELFQPAWTQKLRQVQSSMTDLVKHIHLGAISLVAVVLIGFSAAALTRPAERVQTPVTRFAPADVQKIVRKDKRRLAEKDCPKPKGRKKAKCITSN